MKIVELTAFPLSFAVPEALQVSLGIGRTVKRDAVLVRVRTDEGLAGWGEAHAGRAPSVIAELLDSTLRPLVLGADAADIDAIWARVYRVQLASHGTGAAAALALSGLDMALWDLKAKAAGLPLHRLLGEAAREIPAYAGGISFGYGTLEALLEETRAALAAGFRALKLRVGQDLASDVARVRAVREAVGPDIELLVDANCRYSLDAARQARAAYAELAVGWLEEPFPAPDFRRYRSLGKAGAVPLAAGENHYLRHDFERLADDGIVTVWQPDLSKCGGITEALRIARLAATHGIRLHPHTSVTGLNMAASLHFLAAIPNGGYFEADWSRYNPLRTELCSPVVEIAATGRVRPPPGPGLGIALDEAALARFPVLRGAGYL
ncbi:MAG TPA: mandelate racemase/muconate lactonizing enzyme family protein [Gammaproteobacteria bacterium]|nr:mandelate racemase/muconate lactonizing enzyme family protein [Gammaproteobacteria bacterium]